MDETLILPANGWRPRPYQRTAWAALEAGCTRLALEWHRRAGKDDVCLHWAALSASRRIGTYWHLLPQQNQARKAIWDAVDPSTGRRRIDNAFPEEMREVTRDAEMFIRFKTASTWQVVGSDNFNSLVGSPPVGIVFSEYALSDPSCWSYLQPILEENGGWALFISTTRGNNHFSRLVDFAKRDREWFGQTLTVEDTKAIPLERVESHRKSLTAERGEAEANALVQQEYYCDRNAALPGAYFGQLMTRAQNEGRIGDFPWLPNLPVGTASDLGRRDSTVIWFYQQLPNGRIRLIDVLEGSGVGIDWYAEKIRQRDYAMVDHIWPHDGDHENIRDIGDANLKKNAEKLGIRPIRVIDRDLTKQIGIQAIRANFPMFEFNATPLPFTINGALETSEQARARMERALNALRQYRRIWNDASQRYDDNPYHDWTSNTADSLRYLARGRRPFMMPTDRAGRATRAITDD